MQYDNADLVILSADGHFRPVPRNHAKWVERYRPRTIKECVLPNALKTPLHSYISKGGGPHLLLVGPPGVGKTTVVRAVSRELHWYSLVVNGAAHATMTNMRGEISEFVTGSSVFNDEPHHGLVFEEADQMKPAVQVAMYGLMEDYDESFTTILCTNFPDAINAAIKSRCRTLLFDYGHDPGRTEVREGFRRRLREILTAEEVECADEILDAVIDRCWPDLRQLLNVLQFG
jgi:DNA polymerase III delta prime subunit